MLTRNETPFAAQGFGDLHRDGMRMAVTTVRGRYVVTADGVLSLDPRQKVILSDIYEGDPHRTPMICAGDLIPYKPAADITVLASAYAPGFRPVPTWEVSIAVEKHEVRLRVHGPRRWEPGLRKFKPSWVLSAPEPVTSVPLDYRQASGGQFAGDPDGGGDPRNPIGPGLLHAKWTSWRTPLRAPQIDSVRMPVDDPFVAPEPQGVGPIPPFWACRTQHLGTRDETWAREICPRMPEDFSYRFFQTAHPALVVPRLASGSMVRLAGLTPNQSTLQFALPEVTPIARHAWRDGRRATARLTLDGLHVDLRDPRGPWRVDLTWRGWIVTCPTYDGATLALASTREAANLPGSGEYGLTEAVEASA